MHEVYEVALGLFADGQHDVGHTASVTLLDAVHDTVEEGEIMRIAAHDEVMHGDHLTHVSWQEERQLVAEAVVELYVGEVDMLGWCQRAPEVGHAAPETLRHPHLGLRHIVEIIGESGVGTRSVEHGSRAFVARGTQHSGDDAAAVVA